MVGVVSRFIYAIAPSQKTDHCLNTSTEQQVSHLDIGETLLQAGLLVVPGVSEVVEVVRLQFIQMWVGVLQMRRSKEPVHIHLCKIHLTCSSASVSKWNEIFVVLVSFPCHPRFVIYGREQTEADFRVFCKPQLSGHGIV